MSQIGIVTPTHPSEPLYWRKQSEVQQLVAKGKLRMLSCGKLAVETYKGAAQSDSQRLSNPVTRVETVTFVYSLKVEKAVKLPVRDWRQSLDLNYPEIGRESNARELRKAMWKRAYPPKTLTEVNEKVNGLEEEARV